MAAQLTFVRNRKGGENLVDPNGYEYRIRRVVEKTNRSYWFCTSKVKDSCPATAITVTTDRTLVRMENEHTHSNRLLEKRVKDVVATNIASVANQPTVAPRTILGSIALDIDNQLPGSSAFIFKPKTVSRRIVL